jgi:hypothetical protein
MSGPIWVPSSMPGADGDLRGLVGDARDDLVEDVLLDVEARARVAALALVEEDPVGGARDRDLEVGVLVQDLRALAAELERDLLEVAGRGLHDLAADLGRAGERDLVDRVVRRECRSGVAEAGHDVDDPGGQPGLLHQLAETQR